MSSDSWPTDCGLLTVLHCVFSSLQLEIKAQVEEYARQRAEEQEILKAAREARKQQEKAVHRLTADEAAKIQERVCFFFKHVLHHLKVVTFALG